MSFDYLIGKEHPRCGLCDAVIPNSLDGQLYNKSHKNHCQYYQADNYPDYEPEGY